MFAKNNKISIFSWSVFLSHRQVESIERPNKGIVCYGLFIGFDDINKNIKRCFECEKKNKSIAALFS